MRDRPWMVLTRHFLGAMFDFGFLSEAGADSFRRLLLGSAAVALGLGLLLARIFMGKYADLAGGPVEAYRSAVAADHAFLVAVPMWIVASAVVMAGHSLFPDETDYRILMAEPLSRTLVFGAKLTSLLLFGALFAGGAHAALLPMLVVTLVGQPDAGAMIATAAAFAVSSAAASLCAALTIVAIHGVLVLAVPRTRALVFAGVTRAALLAALVLALPFLFRLPGADAAFAANRWWLRVVPPAWFVGLEHVLLGDAARAPLALSALAATTAAFLVSVVSYAVAYRRFDRVTLRPGTTHVPVWPDRWRAWAIARQPARAAISQFVAITLRRSLLHQGIAVALLAAAAGLVVNGVLANGVPRGPQQAVPWITVWAPLAFMFIAVPAVRLALSVPIDLRANWIVRITEDAATRPDAVAAGVRTVLALGVALPIALVAPLQWWSSGLQTIGLIVLESLVGWLLTEWLMREWRRIPFTCVYIPGKGFVPHMVVKGVVAYLFFTNMVGLLLQLCSVSRVVFGVVAVAVAGAAARLAFRRTEDARILMLNFEEEPPSDVIPLRLNAD